MTVDVGGSVVPTGIKGTGIGEDNQRRASTGTADAKGASKKLARRRAVLSGMTACNQVKKRSRPVVAPSERMKSRSSWGLELYTLEDLIRN